jgi:hypothetical protein
MTHVEFGGFLHRPYRARFERARCPRVPLRFTLGCAAAPLQGFNHLPPYGRLPDTTRSKGGMLISDLKLGLPHESEIRNQFIGHAAISKCNLAAKATVRRKLCPGRIRAEIFFSWQGPLQQPCLEAVSSRHSNRNSP